jgi:hypothetical protein
MFTTLLTYGLFVCLLLEKSTEGREMTWMKLSPATLYKIHTYIIDFVLLYIS